MNEKDLFVCDYVDCKKYLIEPISFHCGYTICQSHLMQSNEEHFKCYVCEEQHPTKNNQINKKLANLIASNKHLSGINLFIYLRYQVI